MKMSIADWAIVFVGLMLFLFGAGLDLTVIGLPAGITADVLGIVLMGFGFRKELKLGGK